MPIRSREAAREQVAARLLDSLDDLVRRHRSLIATVNDLRTLFLILAFVSIRLEFRVAPLREAGWRPIGVFASATVGNLAVGLGLAVLLFSGFAAA